MSNDKAILPKATHYGVVHFGDDVECEAVVLANGQRGFNRRQLAEAVGFHANTASHRFTKFLAVNAPNALKIYKETSSPILMPNGATAIFTSCDIIPETVNAVISKAIAGTLSQHHRALVNPCLAIQCSLSKVGIIALIDEATGYQYDRVPDALQTLFDQLVRDQQLEWEPRFHPDYYVATFRLFGWQYTGQREKPMIIGKITAQWVYAAIFPQEIVDTLRINSVKAKSKFHQWLKDGGLRLLDKQINAVTMIARSSTDYNDFMVRCGVAFHSRGQNALVFPFGVQ